jgi:hypothetical protein
MPKIGLDGSSSAPGLTMSLAPFSAVVMMMSTSRAWAESSAISARMNAGVNSRA